LANLIWTILGNPFLPQLSILHGPLLKHYGIFVAPKLIQIVHLI
jgi:hypothetical protein